MGDVLGWRGLFVALGAAIFCLSFAAGPALAADNLPPEISAPATDSVNEDTNRTFNAANANQISVTDPDADPDDVQILLSANDGVLTLSTVAGLSFTVGDGTSDDAMAFQGTLAEVNAALDGLVYRGETNFNGADTISIVADDLGHNGDGGVESDSHDINMTVNAVNDNPVNSLPATQTIDEDTTLTFGPGSSNQISVSDVDALPADDLRLTLNTTPTGSFPTGTITVDDRGPLTFTTGDGIDDQSMTFEGTLDEINAALDGMTFTPNQDMYGTSYGAGAGNIRISTNDLGHNPTPARTDSDELAVHIDPIDNDPPTVQIIQGIGTYENVPEELSLANGNQLEARDLDNDELATDQLQVFLSVTNGTLSFDDTTGLSFGLGDGSADGAMSFSGQRSAITGAFDTGVTFTPDPGFDGVADLSMGLEDLTNGGTDNDVAEIRVDVPTESVYYSGSKVTGTTLVPNVGAVLGRAALDGSGGANLFGGPALADNPAGIAIDLIDEKIYWSVAHPSDGIPRIYRADLDGSGTPEVFVAGSGSTPAGTVMSSTPSALVVDQSTRRLYWSSIDTTPPFDLANKAISYVSLDGPSPATSGGNVAVSTGTGSGGPRPFVLDLENERFFFGDTNGDAVGVTPIPGASGTNSRFTVTGAAPSDPLGIAYDPAADRLYWGNSTGDPADERVRYADMNGTTSVTGQVFDTGVSAGGGVRGMALDPESNRLYWGLTSGGGQVEHASLDGDGTDSGDVDLGDANHNNLDGVTLLKDPEPVDPPLISGEGAVGSELTCTEGTWESDLTSGGLYRMPKSTSVAWTLDGQLLDGADQNTLTVEAPGEYRCLSRGTNFAGTTTQESDPLSVLAPNPSNKFTIGSISLDRKRGQATIKVTVPGPGKLALAGENIKKATATVAAAGAAQLVVRPYGKQIKRLLRRRGKAQVTAKVTFTPDGGQSRSATRKILLRKKR